MRGEVRRSSTFLQTLAVGYAGSRASSVIITIPRYNPQRYRRKVYYGLIKGFLMATQDENSVQNAANQYDDEGYGLVRNVIDDELIEMGRQHVDWLQQEYPDKRPEALDNLLQHDPFWVRLVSDNRLLDIAETVLGPNIQLYASHYVAKPPQNGQPVLWHQDGAYWGIEPMEVMTVWLALDPSMPKNGCMRVIPGTQDMNLKEIQERHDVDNVLSSETAADVDESNAVDLELEPGDISIHHPNIIHGSEGNNSDQWRRGLTIRYIPTSTRIVEERDPWPTSFFLRGDPASGANKYQPWPLYDPDSKYMEFDGWEEYNERARRMNERVAEVDRFYDSTE